MFDKNTIAQLSELKEVIVSSKDYAEGIVLGANGRFGFVKTDDNRTAFLNPERMQNVLPGDRVKVLLTTNKKDKLEAEVEKLLEQGTTKFVGHYRVKGNNHFVQIEGQAGARWIYIPPQQRKNCQENDLVHAELVKHPFKDGKASARILTRIGAETDDFIHHNRIIAQYDLDIDWSKDAQQQADKAAADISLDDREDFTHLPFVTIDSPSTRDMDDAIYAIKENDDSYQLWVAVADPGSFILPGSPVAKTARNAAQSVYLPARTIPMLPEILATDTFSLTEDTIRPVLICKMVINNEGEITHFDFKYAKAKSHKKLNYREVAPFVDDETQTQSQTISDCSDEIKASLKMASEISLKRLEYRKKHNQVNENPADYDFRINAEGYIDGITKRERNSAHRLVEEAMLSTNMCAGELLAEHNAGVFSTQLGFRLDRIGEVKAVLREDVSNETNFDNINEYDAHLALIEQIKQQHPELLAPLKRMMQPAEISTNAEPHLNLGVKHYATVTSPIRRYADLCNHWSIIQILTGQKAQQMPTKVLEQLKERLSNNRLACRRLELTLIGHYLMGNGDKNNCLFGDIATDNALSGEAEVRIITQQGFGVRLSENGIEGFIQVPKKLEKVYDAKRMTLTINGKKIALDSTVNVKITGVDLEKRRVKMELTEGFPELPATNIEPTS